MACTDKCCASLEDPQALMKMGLSMVLLGHVNFLLGALVHGVVLRHINLHKQARAMEYAISNVVALTTGLVGVVVGILAIILSKHKRSRALSWSLFIISLCSGLMATASAIGLLVSMVRAILHGGRSLLMHCRFPDAIGYSSITNECPFDPTRIYGTTLILWVPLIVTCIIQLVFSAQCLSVTMSFLGLPCCPHKKTVRQRDRTINAAQPVELTAVPHYAPSPQQQHRPQQHHPPPHHRQHHSLPSERQPLRQPHRGRPEERVRNQHRPSQQQQQQRLERGALERSSFWI
ncbi:transmembrane protein 54-like [Lampris incognitus]|uniref:transmembrane protein 54-like n=1 Tax=Lampris incognitus TaxID=2546036 RepID=UPI0024B55828|nr:transmembrane protein 54-like [Lampris incognitus]